jgi:hypothetical protein
MPVAGRACVRACCVTPFGPGVCSHIVERLQGQWKNDQTLHWQDAHAQQWHSGDDAEDGWRTEATRQRASTRRAHPAEGWTQHVSRSSGDLYYVNSLTGESTYDLPMEPVDAAQVRRLLLTDIVLSPVRVY